MARIRSVPPDGAALFIEAAASASGAAAAAEIRQAWESGRSRPSWCFVAEEGGRPVGRLGYRTVEFGPPGTVEPFVFELDWSGDYRGLGCALVRQSLGPVAADGPTHLACELYLGPEDPGPRRAVLEEAGIALVQEMDCLVLDGPGPRGGAPDRLVFRSLPAVGEAPFLEAIRRATAASLDRFIPLFVEQAGSDRAFARHYFDFSRGNANFDPDWWHLAYDGAGELVGLIQPELFPFPSPEGAYDGLVAYLGVVPQQRGKGYVHDLLAKATAVARAAGAATVYAQTDTRNAPMLRAFERAGYARHNTILKYHAPIAGVLGR